MHVPQNPPDDPAAQLSRAQADFSRFFNLSLDLLCVAGTDGYFKRVNPSWTRVLGWSEAELHAQQVKYFMHPDDRERTLQVRETLLEGVPVRGLENRYLCKDGSFRWLSWESVFAPESSMIFGVARDITERRQREQERIMVSNLEATGILAGGIAHDFNNLLASLLLNLEMVSLCATTTVQQEQYLRDARKAVQAANSLTLQLITFADGGESVRRVCELKGLLEHSLDFALKGSAIRSECSIADDLWPAEVDENQLGQVIRGVVANAREAMANVGLVRIQAENVAVGAMNSAELSPGDYVRITVQDNGAGIPTNVLPKIFDPYFSTKPRGTQKGMGLGLTICRSIMRNHGGTMTISSQSGLGTRVICHLPAARRNIFPTEPTVPSTSAVARKILVMDDEEAFREIMASILGGLGYQVELARNGEEAIAFYEQARAAGQPFAAVLLDLSVRLGLGGAQAMVALQAGDPLVNAVLMSSGSNNHIFQEYRRYGFKGALAKPFSTASLRVLLTEILGSPLQDYDSGL